MLIRSFYADLSKVNDPSVYGDPIQFSALRMEVILTRTGFLSSLWHIFPAELNCSPSFLEPIPEQRFQLSRFGASHGLPCINRG